MKILKWLSVGIAVVAMIGLTAVAVIASRQIIEHLLAAGVHDAAYYKFCQDVFKTVTVGLVIGALGIVIPAFLTYSRDKFERLQNSRVAYSSAKTGVDYLALRLSALNLSKAGCLIQDVHFQKHQAQLYEKELKLHLKLRYDSPISPDVWDKAMYRKLRNARVLLKRHAGKWDTLTPRERLEILLPVLPDIDETSEGYTPFSTEEKSIDENGYETGDLRQGDTFSAHDL